MSAILAETELVYLGSFDNVINLQLQNDGVPLNLSSTTQITGNVGGLITVSTNTSNDLIRWEQPGYQTGEIRCKLGVLPGLTIGFHEFWVIVFDALHINGVVFEPIPIQVVTLP